jgi:hypothetical protein
MPAEYVPTADQRALVESAAAFGITRCRPGCRSLVRPAMSANSQPGEADWAAHRKTSRTELLGLRDGFTREHVDLCNI